MFFSFAPVIVPSIDPSNIIELESLLTNVDDVIRFVFDRSNLSSRLGNENSELRKEICDKEDTINQVF